RNPSTSLGMTGLCGRASLVRHSVIRHWSLTPVQCHNPCRQKNVHQRYFEKEKPAQPHQLIPSKSRESPAHPQKQENHERYLYEKDSDVDQAEDPSARAIRYSRKMPAAQK